MTRFALIGYGAIGRFRAQALRETPGAELALVVEPIAERRAEAERMGLRTAASLEAAVTADDIDAVIVSTPPNLHREHCEPLLRAGKHVLCEKPLATSFADAEHIVAAAQESGRTLGTGFNYRFYPAVAKARELIAAGRIGDVDHVKGFAGHPGGPEFTHQWVHDPRIMGGGALMDNGIHLADLTLHFLGKPSESFGWVTERIWQFHGSEDNGFVLMHTSEGRVGLLHASWSTWHGYHFDVEICGTRGSLYVRYPPMLVVLHKRPAGSAKRGPRQIFLFPTFQIQERLRSYRWTLVQSFVAEQLDFLRRIEGRAGVGASGLDGLQAIALAQSAYGRGHQASAQTHQHSFGKLVGSPEAMGLEQRS
jgi:predicted dehydrogenase